MAKKVLVNCHVCYGAGLEKAGPEEIKLGIICKNCKGSGSEEMEIFEGRVVLEDFRLVAVHGPYHHYRPDCTISYQEFLDGKMPIRPDSMKPPNETFNRAKVEAILDEKPASHGLNLDGMFP